ncbi:MAG TPA: hypothetical protein VMX17_07470 [Candidatus Glassbacteria bacterium]|nr:hypothetical protein [Candidatus Glassbacteria bacterium]
MPTYFIGFDNTLVNWFSGDLYYFSLPEDKSACNKFYSLSINSKMAFDRILSVGATKFRIEADKKDFCNIYTQYVKTFHEQNNQYKDKISKFFDGKNRVSAQCLNSINHGWRFTYKFHVHCHSITPSEIIGKNVIIPSTRQEVFGKMLEIDEQTQNIQVSRIKELIRRILDIRYADSWKDQNDLTEKRKYLLIKEAASKTDWTEPDSPFKFYVKASKVIKDPLRSMASMMPKLERHELDIDQHKKLLEMVR